ncbi:hypothetical protein ASE36_00400 [Rhizobium sp. Root274]|uniref:hypothetical protein n=1 Tax=unclassified Rhizobium TaxID=2613769 RepID=UPI0007127C63|nr:MULTISPECIES: hypothetical protein [unclassified Rhizobium]KQW30799.1 hypothetical protein ASC71_00400 [Rhizobium sp. Root1240]KRD32346.1 hypothetical protein ASE36_00400 [Rhizobium sp. Root274]
MVTDRTQVLGAIVASASMLNLHPAVTEEMKISDFSGDSLEYLELLLGVEMELDLDKEVPDANAPAREATVGELADWIVGVVNG